MKVYCIDPWEENAGVRPLEERYGVKYSLEQFKIYTQDCPNIVPIKGYSPRDVQNWTDHIDLYFEDSVHQNPALKKNLEFWHRKIKNHGIICGHDYIEKFPDVMNEVQRLAYIMDREICLVQSLWYLLPNSDEAKERMLSGGLRPI